MRIRTLACGGIARAVRLTWGHCPGYAGQVREQGVQAYRPGRVPPLVRWDFVAERPSLVGHIFFPSRGAMYRWLKEFSRAKRESVVFEFLPCGESSSTWAMSSAFKDGRCRVAGRNKPESSDEMRLGQD